MWLWSFLSISDICLYLLAFFRSLFLFLCQAAATTSFRLVIVGTGDTTVHFPQTKDVEGVERLDDGYKSYVIAASHDRKRTAPIRRWLELASIRTVWKMVSTRQYRTSYIRWVRDSLLAELVIIISKQNPGIIRQIIQWSLIYPSSV